MADRSQVDEILDFAIQNEQNAADFYRDLAGKVKTAGMRQVFEDFAREELGHKAKLREVKAGKRMVSSVEKVMDLKIADYLVDETPDENIDYQGSLILAMKQEKAAFKLYSDLAARAPDAELRDILLGLAQEEAKHKLRFEIEYDDRVLQEN